MMNPAKQAALREQQSPERKGHWMRTHSGKRYWPLDPREEDVCIEDIAHHLSLLCRYTGAVPRFYSVAEHSVLVSLSVSPKNALCGLLHDATEAYLGDVGRPLKVHLPQYYEVEELNWRVICSAFDLPLEMPHDVKLMDGLMVARELEDFGMDPSRHMIEETKGMAPPSHVRAVGLQPDDARRLFMDRYRFLNGGKV